MKKLLMLGLFVSLSSVAETNARVYSTSLNYAQVQNVDAVQSKDGSWCFATQVRHNDQSWKHYADAWQVTDLEGNVLGNRELAHPHDNEQPFTRRLCNIEIAEALQKVVVSSKCNVHGYGGETVVLDLSVTKGKGFTVKRVN